MAKVSPNIAQKVAEESKARAGVFSSLSLANEIAWNRIAGTMF
jgi:hypothetical protein